MQRLPGSWIFLLLLLLVDLYVFQVVKSLSQGLPTKTKWIIYGTYWGISILSVSLMLALAHTSFENWHRMLRTYLFATLIGLFFAKFTASAFFLIDDGRRLLQWFASLFVPSLNPKNAGMEGGITRSAFLSWAGFAVGGTLFGTLLYGFGNKYKYNLQKIALQFPNLPKVFSGFKIIHISDIHCGSFTDKAAVKKGIDLVNKQNADVILFTGDLVNYSADEMNEYIDIFQLLSAKHGVFATLGNHDYGFPLGETKEERQIKQLANAAAVAQMHQKLGWKLLSNTHCVIEREGQCIAVLGVDNISAKVNFPSFGKLKDAYTGAADVPFKILMSHDPSHWQAEVVKQFTDIDLTLSGHTHGMQFGVEIPGFRWSPVKYVYKQWAGLYEEAAQKLYVNRGFGFIGYPGRVGILPEVTLIELS